MKNSQRDKRIRALVKRLNVQRKKQAKQIDILCNDIIQAHRGFIANLEKLAFTAQFSESIIGINALDHLFYCAAGVIRQHFPQESLIFCVKKENDYNLYSFEADNYEVTESQRMEQYLTSELVNAVINSGRLCKIDDLLEMGLQINPTIAKKLSVATIPLADNGPVAGFILLYNTSEKELTESRLEKLAAIRRSLSLAIKSCTMTQHTNN
ncbi:MAG: GAF domain-containing protein [Sedimentisphaerales bacterium]|nr:GAF domain-containing protein [Sedimentisphaerales bacterium]